MQSHCGACRYRRSHCCVAVADEVTAVLMLVGLLVVRLLVVSFEGLQRPPICGWHHGEISGLRANSSQALHVHVGPISCSLVALVVVDFLDSGLGPSVDVVMRIVFDQPPLSPLPSSWPRVMWLSLNLAAASSCLRV